MTIRHVKSKADPMKIMGFVKDLPDKIAGVRKDHTGIVEEFWAVFAREFYKRLSRGFLKKSMGGSDNLGNRWKPLSPRTIEKRKRQGTRHGGLRKSKTFREAVTQAAKSHIPILIDTGRLYTSLLPGRVSGGTYTKKNEDQIFEVKRGQVSLGTKVPYAETQHKARPLWPPEMDRWIDESIDEALKVMTRLLVQKGLLSR